MIDKSLFTNSNFGLKALGFSDKTVLEWNRSSRSLRAKGIQIVEFEPKLEWHNRWFMIVESKTNLDDTVAVKDSDYYDHLNESIKKGFFTDSGESIAYWINVFSGINLSGFNIPVDDLRSTELHTLSSNIDFYGLHLKFFPYQDLMVALNNYKEEHTEKSILGSRVIWFYIYYYSIFLHRLKRQDPDSYLLYGRWYTDFFDDNDLYRRLPSERITLLILKYGEALIANSKESVNVIRNLIKSVESIGISFDGSGDLLREILIQSEKEEDLNLQSASCEKMLNLMISVFSKDIHVLCLQEVLDNKSLLGLHNALPIIQQLRYGPNSIFNMTGIIKDKIFDSDEMGVGEFEEDLNSLPRISPDKRKIYIENVQYWFDIDLSIGEKLLDLVKTNVSIETAALMEEVAFNRCVNHWVNVINAISAPILNWEVESMTLFPKLNLFTDGEFVSLIEEHRHSEEEVMKEQELLNLHLKEIGELEYKHKLDAYLESGTPFFTYGEFQNYWEDEVERAIVRIELKERVYETRMKELGIFDSPLNPAVKTIYLKEMMAIEEEIRPYIQFVKNAFRTALPIRRSVNFSANRHASSGVEFDPDTLFDQEKWIRANVMKVMESKTERGEAVQINTFCLDFSGSMTHVRMRNLFKILYLLILGLEDRKSFDAFHFFSNNFIEVSNFSNEFTSRKVLFRIIKQVTKLNVGKVVFGGFGATHMSEGMEMSLDKMSAFTKEFKRNNPDANVVNSMFVISDGEPNMGITDLKELSNFVDALRMNHEVAIKGIFIKSEEDVNSNFMKKIFGAEHCIESSDFKEGVDRFVSIMTKTYKKQRKSYKWKLKKRKLGLGK